MPKLPNLSGKEIIKLLESNGCVVVRQRGSHIRLKHKNLEPVTVPDHKSISKGLLHRIYARQKISTKDLL